MTAHTNPAGIKPLTLSLTVEVAMTSAHMAGYELYYGLTAGEARSNALEHLCPAVRDALSEAPTPLLADYSTRALSPARELSHQPYIVSTTVKLTVTVKQQEQWAVEYGLDQAEVQPDVRGYVHAVIQDALDATQCPLLRRYSAYTVSQPR